ncbi:AAA family ATPase [Aliifodinibius salicampi]|uniref:AAA family ATPase n=1 Tax=Fodinibius salicampi TaxID=1920655 RepID=A0ABT3PZV8_9BACT|nr:AAA family ATPase [Fodinibius salicampi]MCW9713364.1 AAA family ATPase [Fodinibius salicampi]
MSKLDKLKIQGFKSIREAEISLTDINVLIGPNAIGKSNFISLFNLFNSLIKEELQNYVAKSGGADSLLHYGSKETSKMEFELFFGQNSYRIVLEPTHDDKLLISKEYCRFHKKGYDTPYTEKIGSSNFESNLNKKVRKNLRRRVPYYVQDALKNWKVYHFHDTSDDAGVKKTCKIDDNISLKKDASNLAAFLYRLKETAPENYSLIERTVKRIIPFFGRFELHPSRLNEDTIKLEWREQGNDKYFNANDLSDGTIRFISLATLLLQPSLPSTIIIDEPELGLHPKAISILGSLFRKASHRTQLIISTQSVNLVNEFDPSDIMVLDRQDAQTKFEHLDLESLNNWLEDYSIGEIWEKNLIGGRPQ